MDAPPIASIGALIGDPARALMLSALMDGRARTASELADRAGITRQTASAHLAKLTDGGLLSPERQGRHRYFQLRSEEVASVLESLMVLGHQLPREHRSGRPQSPERCARTCYDHLAGRLGVELLEGLDKGGYLETRSAELFLSPSGEELFDRLGIDWCGLRRGRRSYARLCLDWSERRHHLAGALGAALLCHFLDGDWIRRRPGSRAVVITSKGRKAFKHWFNLSL